MDLPINASGEYCQLIRPEIPHQDRSTTNQSKVTKAVVGLLLLSIVTTCTVLSKLSLISLESRVGQVIDNNDFATNSVTAGLYWQLLLILLAPQIVTFFRTLVFGLCGQQSSPWPAKRAIIMTIVASMFEAGAMTLIVFCVLPRLPSVLAIFLLCGVFPTQALVDCLYLEWSPYHRRHNGYANMDENGHLANNHGRKQGWMAKVLENKFSRAIALLLQVVFIIVIATSSALQCKDGKDRLFVGCSTFFGLVILSAVWSSKVQQENNRAQNVARRNDIPGIFRQRNIQQFPSARFKSSFISSLVQIIMYFAITLLLSIDQRIDLWCFHRDCSLSQAFLWATDHSFDNGVAYRLFLMQILSSFCGHAFIWISCTMVFHRWGLAFPMYLCTPISVVICGISGSSLFYFQELNTDSLLQVVALTAGVMLWFGQMMTMGVYIWEKKNLILAKDGGMFISPRYDAVFLEQHTMLNRQVKKGKNIPTSIADRTRPRTIFVCSTMYHEDVDEMKQMLSSIYQLACYYHSKKENDPEFRDHYESHIFLDGGASGNQLSYFALQLVSLFEETLHVHIRVFQKFNTPYGCQMSWYIEDIMPIYVHLKDSLKVKNKKRWSQVMYMNYVLNFRVKENIRHLHNREVPNEQRHAEDGNIMDDDNTFILTTDADIRFTPESAILLLDRLDSDPMVGAVCSRTHPQGSGPVYWYQVFDYAIGHWFQKAAEDIMGTVLCCPGCFSIFRCRALRSVLDKYSSEVTSASDFLTKDMGEDRWLCTLLVEKGWRLSYCAISENHTHCPESMDEFFKQRRRWVPSTIANIILLLSRSGKIKKANDRISTLFIIFEFAIVFTTAISPATVILVIAEGLNATFGVDSTGITVLLVIFCLAFGLLCLYGDPQLQLDVSLACTFFFSLLMATVIVGYINDMTTDILNFVSTIVQHSGEKGPLPTFLDPTTIYLLLLAAVFIIAAVLHPNEWTCLLYFIWYLIALPAGYLTLIIYSAVNLNSRSWGTREGDEGAMVGIYGSTRILMQKIWTRFTQCLAQCRCCLVTPPNAINASHGLQVVEDKVQIAQVDERFAINVDEDDFKLTADVEQWLQRIDCVQFAANFEQGGYFTLHFIAAMKSEDFHAIGITDRGYRLRLEREARRLPTLPIDRPIHNDVADWLRKLELQGYQKLFAAYGYSSKEDLESVEGLTMEDLKQMGIYKRAHQQRILQGINRLIHPSAMEISISQCKCIIESVPTQEAVMEEGDQEKQFWTDLVHSTLAPVNIGTVSSNELNKKLRLFRNTVLCIGILINLMWIVLVYTLTIPVEAAYRYKIPTKALPDLFLFIYVIIMLIQFSSMIVHRCVTLVHYLARAAPGGWLAE